MVTINSEHISQLIGIESGIEYGKPPEEGKHPFVVVSRPSPVLLSAPHGARTYRKSSKEIWHEEDEYTAGMALLLGELCETSVVAMVSRNDQYDPNYHKDVAYKNQLREVVEENNVRYILDLHGAALYSSTLSPTQTIDLGYRSDDPKERSMDEIHTRELERLLIVDDASCDPRCFVVERNHFSAAGNSTYEPITTFVHCLGVQALQIEMKPQVRVAHRFPTASLFKSCGDYDADPRCVMHMLQSLADFIDYLKSTIKEEDK